MGGKCQEDSVIRVWSISKQNKYQALLDLELSITQAPYWDFFSCNALSDWYFSVYAFVHSVYAFVHLLSCVDMKLHQFYFSG